MDIKIGEESRAEFSRLQFLNEWKQREKAEKIERYRHLNQMARKGQILFCGSSLMEQFPVSELMLDAGLSFNIYNRGVGGLTTQEMLDHLDVLVTDLEPAHIFINIGTNDLNDEYYDVSDLIGRYEEILGIIKTRLPKAGIYVLAYYPGNMSIDGIDPVLREKFRFRNNDRIKEANQELEKLSDRLHINFIDCNSAITGEDGNLRPEFCIDGIHIYGDGYAEILNVLMPVLERLA